MSIHKPASRLEFKEYALRSLGKGAVRINVTDLQVEDAIEYALNYYKEHHINGTFEALFKHQVTDDDVTNGYITLPDTIYGLREVVDLGNTIFPTSGWLSPQYQVTWNEINSLQTINIVPYFMARQHIALINEVLSGTPNVHWNEHVHQLYIDTDWGKLPSGRWLLILAYVITNPDTYPHVWQDRWLQNYTIAQIKLRWGNNTSKHDQIQMLNGVIFNGQRMKEEAKAEIDQLEAECKSSYTQPPIFMIG